MSADFFQAVQAIYECNVLEMAQKFTRLPHPNAIPTPIKEEIDHSDLFGTVAIRTYKWDKMYNAADYVNLLNTYSDHRALDDSTRKALFLDIAELINVRFSGQIIKEYLTVLYLAQVAVSPLEELGYAYWFDNPDPQRMFFVKGLPPNSPRTHHVHMVESGSILMERLLFRDYLREHPDEALRYAQLKRHLAEQFPTDREAYTSGKTEYVQLVMQKSRRETAS